MMRTVLLFFSMFVFCTSLAAQENTDEANLLLAQYGVVWTMLKDGSLVQASWCSTDIPDDVADTIGVFSPQGDLIVYSVLSPIAYRVLEEYGGLFLGLGVRDIVICTPSETDADFVIGQPEDAKFVLGSEDEEDYKYLTRSPVSWSPDGSKLTWTQYLNNEVESPELVQVDVHTNEVIVLPFPYIVRTQVHWAPHVTWTKHGYLAMGTQEGDGGDENLFALIDFDGELLSEIVLPQELQHQSVRQIISIEDGNDLTIAFSIIRDGWYLLDWESETFTRFSDEEYVEVVSKAKPTGTGFAHLTHDENGDYRPSLQIVSGQADSDVVREDPLFWSITPRSTIALAISELGGMAWIEDANTVFVVPISGSLFSIREFVSTNNLSLWWGALDHRIVVLN